jgi:hypothetical protein
MFKPIPGNTEYKVSLSGKIVNYNGWECTPEVIDGKIKIEMYGIVRSVDLIWLSLITHYEVNLDNSLKKYINRISFEDYPSIGRINLESHKMMIINPPIIVAKKYRIIPCFTDYAISKDGDVILIKNLEGVKINPVYINQYPTISLYNPVKSRMNSVSIHRLVGMAWVPNISYIDNPIINHKNGNKHIYHKDNLEWCTYKHNSLHAVNNNLTEGNVECKVRDVETGHVTIFASVRQACEFMGVNTSIHTHTLLRKTKHRLTAKKYEFKLLGDQTPWFYDEHAVGDKSGRYTLKVILLDGTCETFPDIRSFKKIFGVWNVSNVYQLKDKAEKMYPGMSIEIIDNYQVSIVQAYCIKTGELIEASGIRPMSRLLEVNYSKIHDALQKGDETRIVDDYAYRYKKDTPWNTNFTRYMSSPKCILATNSDTENTIEFKSLREAARHFNIERCTIKRILDTNISKSGWTFVNKS